MTRVASRLVAALAVLLALSSPIGHGALPSVRAALIGSRHARHHSDNASNGSLDQRDAAAHMVATTASASGTSEIGTTVSRPRPERPSDAPQSARVSPSARAHAPAYLHAYSLLI